MINFKIHIRMAEKRISQKSASQFVGITPTVMGKYFHGTITRMNPAHLEKFCKLLDSNIQDLIEYIPDEELSKN